MGMKFFRKIDIIIVSVIIVLGLLSWGAYKLLSRGSGIAEIYYGSELVLTVDLDKGIDKRFSVPQNEHVIFHLHKDGSISFEESDCPDKICIKTGKLSRIGETAACLPNNLLLKIVPVRRDEDTPDMIIG